MYILSPMHDFAPKILLPFSKKASSSLLHHTVREATKGFFFSSLRNYFFIRDSEVSEACRSSALGVRRRRRRPIASPLSFIS